MSWTVVFHQDFSTEVDELPRLVRRELFAQMEWIKEFGPTAKRPRVDTLKASRFANMKELRFDAENGVWRVAFAFDPIRNAILLVAGDKAGVSERKFYKDLIEKADRRFEGHLEQLKQDQLTKAAKGRLQ